MLVTTRGYSGTISDVVLRGYTIGDYISPGYENKRRTTNQMINITTSSSSFSRPADTTAYTIGDLVANSATAGSVVPMVFTTSKLGAGRGVIRRARLFKDNEAVTAASFNLHLFATSPTVTNGDNGALAVDTSRYFLGTVAVDASTGAFVTTTDLIKAAAASPEINFDLTASMQSERRIYGLLEARGAYTPASGETFEVTLELSL